MRSVEQIGKTIEEAKQQAMEKLGVQDESQMSVEVLDEGAKGVFGWGTKYARIKVTVEDKEPVDIKKVISEILILMELKAEVSDVIEEEDQQKINVNGENLGALIGKHGQTLEAFQFIVNLIVNKQRIEKKKVIVDVEGYRVRRENSLRDLAVRSAQRVKREKKNVILEPMVPSERRVVHLALKNESDIVTYSNGQEPLRRVVIALRKSERQENGGRRQENDSRRRVMPRRRSTFQQRQETPREFEEPKTEDRFRDFAAPVQYDQSDVISDMAEKEDLKSGFEEKEAQGQGIVAPVQFDQP